MTWNVRYDPTLAATQGGATTLQQDFDNRMNAAGVVWGHDFKLSTEVSNFAHDSHLSSDPYTLSHSPTGGLSGGRCIMTVPAGGTAVSGWDRPFSPFVAGTTSGNGRGAGNPDPALGGTLTRQSWTLESNNAQIGKWGKGYYCHSAYNNDGTARNPGGSSGFTADNIPGNEFYIQALIRIPAARFASGQPDGKLLMVMITGDGPTVLTGQPRTPDQELVVKSNPNSIYEMYTNFGRQSNSFIYSDQANQSGNFQPGGVAPLCDSANHGQGPLDSDPAMRNLCWMWQPDIWHAILIYMKPGHNGDPTGDSPSFPNAANDTIVKIWMARQGETSYTKIWDKSDYVWCYGGGDPWPMGFNMLAFNAYMNDQPAIAGWTHEMAQCIFSRSTIACPQVWPA